MFLQGGIQMLSCLGLLFVTKFKQFDEEITLISCTQIEKVDNVDTYFFSQVRGQLVQM